MAPRRSGRAATSSPGLAGSAGLNDEQVHKVARGNAIRAFDLARLGISYERESAASKNPR